MKLVKRLLTIITAFVLVLSMGGMKAIAEQTGNEDTGNLTFVIKNNNASGYEYLLYQMLVGDIVTIGNQKVFTNVEWGSGVAGKGETIEKVYAMAGLTGSNKTPQKFAEWLSPQSDAVFHQMMVELQSNDGSSLNSGTPLTYSDSWNVGGTEGTVAGYGKNQLKSGYYLVRNTHVPEGHTYSDYIVVVLTENTVATPKDSGTPSSEKKVTDTNDSYPNNAEINATGDSADHDIGDSIPYTLSVRIPKEYKTYNKYMLEFQDTMSKGLTYNGDAKIYFGVTDTVGKSISFTPALQDDGSTKYTYAIEDLKNAAPNLADNDIVRITYTATLNKDAVIGGTGNPNTFQVVYSNNPTGTTTGTTVPDKNTVFTFQIVVNKVKAGENGNITPLSGAEFTLFKKIGDNWTDVTTLGSGENKPTMIKSASGETADSVFTFKGLDDGLYKLEETTTPVGYNTIPPKFFTVTATHDIEAAEPTITGLSGAGYDGSSITFTANKTTGTLSTDIINESGSTLPTTGAKGTSFLVIGGSAIALIGILILVTRRRMMAE